MPQSQPAAPLTEADWAVLSRLEDAEQDLINFGIYETHTAPGSLVESLRDAGGNAPSEADVRASLDRICGQFQALKVGRDSYRSRIAEIVRLLKNVKQRFAAGDADKAPFLVQAVRVRFRDRRRLNRIEPAANAFRRLFHDHRDTGLVKLDTARQVVLNAAADAIGVQAADLKLTGVQNRALGEVGSAYLGRSGRGFVVTGNTGSGKTEAVLLPLLVGALQERFAGKVGCKVLLVYPRQALARNQLDRLVRYLARVNQRVATAAGLGVSDRTLSAGILFGETPEDDQQLAAGNEFRRRWDNNGAEFTLPYFNTEDGFPRFLGDVVLHSLERGLRNLFLVEGCTRDEEVGTHATLWASHGREPADPALYVYERNQDGNGATRLLADGLRRGSGHAVRRWWGCTCGCPVGDEEDFVRYALRSHQKELAAFAARFRVAPLDNKPSPRATVEGVASAYRATDADDPALGRLAAVLTGELTFGGDTVPSLELTLELLALEDELAARFHRPVLPVELAGFAATRAERLPASVPTLRRLYDIYQRHAADLGWDPDDESGAANPLDRFLAQVEQLSLTTCADACPACLAGRSPHGPLEVTRHL
ncbi:MAG TPA: DEAD/DEAH box helicase, partial [Urbifossiella sp.]|nr:DEAD/DEAH box helicase [Urbifossiella sp.]